MDFFHQSTRGGQALFSMMLCFETCQGNILLTQDNAHRDDAYKPILGEHFEPPFKQNWQPSASSPSLHNSIT
jgi:hypothetical protein